MMFQAFAIVLCVSVLAVFGRYAQTRAADLNDPGASGFSAVDVTPQDSGDPNVQPDPTASPDGAATDAPADTASPAGDPSNDPGAPVESAAPGTDDPGTPDPSSDFPVPTDTPSPSPSVDAGTNTDDPGASPTDEPASSPDASAVPSSSPDDSPSPSPSGSESEPPTQSPGDGVTNVPVIGGDPDETTPPPSDDGGAQVDSGMITLTVTGAVEGQDVFSYGVIAGNTDFSVSADSDYVGSGHYFWVLTTTQDGNTAYISDTYDWTAETVTVPDDLLQSMAVAGDYDISFQLQCDDDNDYSADISVTVIQPTLTVVVDDNAQYAVVSDGNGGFWYAMPGTTVYTEGVTGGSYTGTLYAPYCTGSEVSDQCDIVPQWNPDGYWDGCDATLTLTMDSSDDSTVTFEPAILNPAFSQSQFNGDITTYFYGIGKSN